MSATRHAILPVALVLAGTGFAQVSSVAPKGHYDAIPIELLSVTRVETSHNNPTVIRQELLDTNTIAAIAGSTGLAAKELAALAVASGPADSELWLYRTGASPKTAKVFGEKLHFYIQGRLDGHTPGFLLNSLTNRNRAVQAIDPDLRALLSQRPELFGSRLERSGSGSFTNQAEEIFRTAKYCVVDGEIAWCYEFCLSREGTAFDISERREDAKEWDPKFSAIIAETGSAVRAEMQQNGTWGKFGSVRAFWRSKKENLKAKGIAWRSPEDLNPGVIVE